MMLGVAVGAEVARHDRRDRVVLVEQKRRDRIATLGGKVADQPVDGPVADLGILRLGQATELLERPDYLNHRSISTRS